jgi:hypothetical protein
MADHKTWRLYSCCPEEHRLAEFCLAGTIVDGAGTVRKIIERRDDDGFLAVTRFPSGLKTKPYPVSRADWVVLWNIVHSEVHEEK